MKKKTMTSAELTDKLEREERKSRLLAELEDDPMKKRSILQKNRKTKKLLRLVRGISHGGMETSATMKPENPEDNMNN